MCTGQAGTAAAAPTVSGSTIAGSSAVATARGEFTTW
jgi:hypothetical protein